MSKKNNIVLSALIYLIMLLLGVGAISLGLFLEHPQAHSLEHLMPKFLIEVGIAALIALIVILTIEQFQRSHQTKFIEETLQQISTHLFNAVYKKFIPENVFNEFVDCLASSNVIRSGHHIEYELKKFEDQSVTKHIQCTGISRYTLKNITQKDIDQCIEFFIEMPLDPTMNGYCRFETIRIGNHSLTQIEIQDHTEPKNDSLCFAKKITIKKGESVNIFTKAKMVKNDVDIENWELMYPSDGVTVRLECDPSLNLKLCAKSRHSKELESIIDEDCKKSWSLNSGTFPHQSICLWWSKNI